MNININIVSNNSSQWVVRSSGQSVVEINARVFVLEQRFGDVGQVLLIGQFVAAVNVVAVSEEFLHVSGDVTGSTVQPGIYRFKSDPERLKKIQTPSSFNGKI